MAIALTRIGQAWTRVAHDGTGRIPVPVCVAAVSLLVSLAMFGWFGIRYGQDSVRYLEGAANLIDGAPLEGKQGSYLGYVTLVGVVTALGADTRVLVLFQILLAALAAVALYDLGRQLSGRAAGVLAAVCFAANVDIARWHLFVLTDSLYISLVILSTWIVHRAAERARWWYAAAVLALVCTAFVRPNGWIFVPVTMLYWTARAPLARRLKYGVAALAVLGCVAAMGLVAGLRQGIQAESPDKWLRQGTVLWNLTDWGVAMPQEPGEPADDGVAGAIRYATRHPVASAQLALTRMGAELLHARPFYSTSRNVFAALSVLAFYPFALFGGWRFRAAPLARLMGAVIGGHLLVVALTFADWDGRFLLYFLPLVYVFAAGDLAARLKPRGQSGRP